MHFSPSSTMSSSVVSLGLWLFRHSLRDRSFPAMVIFFLFLFSVCIYLSFLSLLYPERIFYHSSLMVLLLSCYILIAQYGIVEYRKLFESRQIHLFLASPVTRSQFLLGYFLSLLLLIGGFYLLASLVLSVWVVIIYTYVLPKLWVSLLFQFGAVLLLLCCALFLANLFQSSTAGIFAFVSIVIMGNLIGDAYREVAHGASPIMTAVIYALVYVVPMLDHFRPIPIMGSPHSYSILEGTVLVFYTAGFSLIFLLLASLLLLRKSIE